jgi:hypothetical protein
MFSVVFRLRVRADVALDEALPAAGRMGERLATQPQSSCARLRTPDLRRARQS